MHSIKRRQRRGNFVYKPKKILLISAPIGAGHVKAAEAIGKALLDQEPNAIVRYADLFAFFPKWIGKGLLKIYLSSLSFFPQAYAQAYAWGNESKGALFMRRVISRFFAKKMKKYILDFAPDVVICTHATPAGMIHDLITREKMRMVSVSVITDFVVHRLWINVTTQHYFVAHEALKAFFAARQISLNRVHALGIPIAADFNQEVQKSEIQKVFGILEQAKVILIMGGGAGVLPMPAIVQALNRIKRPLHIFVVTGKNTKLYHKMLHVTVKPQHKIQVMQFVHHIGALMAASDLLISKAGGLTASEALCRCLPIFIYQPIPGQEAANTDFLVAEQVAVRIDDLEMLKIKIDEIFRIDDNVAKNMKINAKKIAKPAAAENIAQYILNNLCK